MTAMGRSPCTWPLWVATCILLLHGNAVLGVPDIVAEQLPSLMKVKAALDPTSKTLTSWNSAAPKCNWRGITCNATGFVTRMHFSTVAFTLSTYGNVPANVASRGDLAGTLSPYLGNLTSLEHLIFFEVSIHGSIPTTIGQLSQLQTLILAVDLTYQDTNSVYGLSVVSEAMHGTLPEALGSLSNLVYLDLSRCRFSGVVPSSLLQLPLLEYMDLHGNFELGGDLSSLLATASLPKLAYLDLSLNNFTGVLPATIGSSAKLSYLNLADNFLAGDVPSDVGNLTSLLYLDLSDNFFTSLPTSIAQLQLLQTLKLDFNAFTGGMPLGLEQLQQLQWLSMGSNGFTGDVLDLSNLTRLTWLDLSYNNFSSGAGGGMPAFVPALGKLTNLFLDFNNWDGPMPANWTTLTSLQTWSCSWCGLSGSLPTNMDHFSALQALYLSFNNLQGPIPASIGDLTELTTLDLSSNQLSGPIPDKISFLPNLTSLFLYNNSLTGPIPSSIGNLTNLGEFLVSQNELTGPIPAGLSNIYGLYQLDVSSNNLTGGFPRSFVNAALPMCSYGCSLVNLSLSNNPLGGSLPAAIGNLIYITILDLHNCSFNGSLPSELANLQSLQLLDLSGNSFSGEVETGLLTDMNALLSLSLANNSLFGPMPSLDNLTSLQMLDMSHNFFTGSLPSYFPDSLVDVDLSNNYLSGEVGANFANLTSLETLNLNNNKLGGPIPVLSAAPNLTVLSLSNNGFNGTVPQFYLNDTAIQLDLLGTDVCTTSTNASVSETLFCASESPATTYTASPVCFNDTCISKNVPSPYVFVRSGQCLCAAPLIVELQLYPALVTTFSAATSRRVQVALAKSLGTAKSQIFVSKAVPADSRGYLVEVLFFSRTSAPLPFVNSSRILKFLFTNGTYPGLFIPRAGFANMVSYTLDVLQLPSSSTSSAPISPSGSSSGGGGGGGGGIAGWALGVIVVGGIAILLAFAAVIFVFVHRKKHHSGDAKDSSWFATRVKKDFVRRFSLAEIYAATNKFSDEELIGVGAYGSVYRGKGPAGEEWAVKRAKSAAQKGLPEGASQKGLADFQNEVDVLSRMRHRNIVTLLGFCDERNEQILVYELMPNGSLKDRLQQAKGTTDKNLFPLGARVEAAMGAAEGLKYLHMFAKPTIIHRDVKPDNILFDSNNEARLADFGLLRDNTEAPIDEEYAGEYQRLDNAFSRTSHSSLHTTVTGTPGYIDPEYYTTNQVSTKSDVYSFGVVLLELITGQPPLVAQGESQQAGSANSANSNSTVPLAQWAKQNADNILALVDPSFHGEFDRPAMRKLSALAFDCIARHSHERPDMDAVGRRLGDIRDQLRAADGALTDLSSSEWPADKDSADLRRELLSRGKQSADSGGSLGSQADKADSGNTSPGRWTYAAER